MIHKISTMCTKIDLIKDKSDKLREYKYNPGFSEGSMTKCDYMIADIQHLCREVADDVEAYKKS